MNREKCTAVVLAAGKGSRMGTKIQKQYLEICGKPVLYYSLAAFAASPIIDEIVLVTGEGKTDYCRKNIIEAYGITKVNKIVVGGKERYESVYKALREIEPEGYVFIHDGARPFVDESIIERTYQAVKEYRACVAGMPSKDTVKIVDENDFAVNTPERRFVWCIQTPQVFETALIRHAYFKLMENEENETGITDDAIFVPMFSKYDIATQSVAEMNQSFSKAHWFGTDSLGRDLWVRAWSGARVSLTIGFAASIINAIVGSIMGGISGFYGGKIDMVIQRVVDVLYGIPSLIVTILLMVVVGNGVHCLILAMCCVGWIGGCRFVRGEVLKLRESDFVSAAKILGVPDIVIIVKHILPNIMGLIITNLTMAIPGAIFQEAFLSYIGLGIKPPNCSWGVLAKDGIAQLRIHPYQVFVPAFLICTTMLALNLLGDGLRDAFDPKLRGTE